MENEHITQMPSQFSDKEQFKQQLIAEAMGLSQQLDILWRFHPNNPKRADVASEYKVMEGHLKSVKEDLARIG